MREVLEVRRESEYFTLEGLRTLTGLPEPKWSFAIFKELMDNGLDVVDDLPEKRITIEVGANYFAIGDSGPGIAEETLDRIHDFGVYVSSKRDFRTPTRGFQGNALKTVIAICELRGLDLHFTTGGKSMSYKLNRAKRQAGIVAFEKTVGHDPGLCNRVIIGGLSLDMNEITDAVWTYYLCNPDVTFILNGTVLPAVVGPVNRTGRTYIHWYDLLKFNQLLQGIVTKDPTRTTKSFCLKFSGTQKIMSRLDFSFKRLADFDRDEAAIGDLYFKLCAAINRPKPTILSSYMTGRDTLLKIHGIDGDHKYKCVYGEYRDSEATIPYVIEGFLLNGRDGEHAGNQILTAINCSIPYEKTPFQFEGCSDVTFCGKDYEADSLKSLLDQSGFTKARGILLYLNFISPHIEFTDKSKTRIISDKFKADLLRVVEYLCRDAIKEVDRARRERRAFDRRRAMIRVRHDSKKELVDRYFLDAYERASGGFLVTVRQIFYVVREIISTRHGVNLTGSDYKSFTQERITRFFDRYPELETRILFDRRGFFVDPFLGRDLPLGTQDVNDFINQMVSDRIYETTSTVFSIPVNLQYNHVLFIEKAGFNTILKQSGLTRELNLGVMATQGFGTRAAKKLMNYFLENGVKVYILHDCDIAGYLIQDKLARGSKTFSKGLDVVEIGLTLADVERLGKKDSAEVVSYKHSYSDALGILGTEEREFFVVDWWDKSKYRRVEINALTTPELLGFIRDKISYEPVSPAVDQLARYIEVDHDQIVKEALFEAFGAGMDLDVDRDALAREVLAHSNGTEHWTQTMARVVKDWSGARVDDLARAISGKWQFPAD